VGHACIVAFGKVFTRIISQFSRLSAYKFWGMLFKGNIFKFGVECGVGKCASLMENWLYLGNGER